MAFKLSARYPWNQSLGQYHSQRESLEHQNPSMCLKTPPSSELRVAKAVISALIFMSLITKFLAIKKLNNNLIYKNSLLRHYVVDALENVNLPFLT